MNYLVQDRDIARQYYNQLIQDQKTAIQNRDKATEEIREQLYNNMLTAALYGKWEEMSPDKLIELRTTGALKPEHYNNLERIRAEQNRASEKAEQEIHKDKLYQDAQDLFARFQLGNEGNAYAEIRGKYSRADAQLVTQYYDRLIQEQRTVQTQQEKEKREKEKNTFAGLYRDYWNNGKLVPNDLLRQLETNDGLTREHLDRAYAMNKALSTREGVEDALRNNPVLNFADKSRMEQEQLIMLQMGTNEDKRRRNVSELLRKLSDGTLTNEEINWAWAHGRISSDDKERLKEYDTKFEREQRQLITRTANELILEIKKLGIKNNSRLYENLYENEALTDFYRAASTLDPHAKNFSDALESIYKSTLSSIQSRYGDTISKGWIFEYPAETRLRESQERMNNYTVPENTPQIYYEPFTVSGDNGVILNPQGETTNFTNVISNIPAPTQTPESTPAQNPDNLSIHGNPLLQRMINPANYRPRQLPRVANPQTLPTLTGIVDLSRSFVPGNFRITSGYSATPTALRNGRGHRAIDIGTPENTPLRIPNGYNWRVTSTGQINQSKSG